MTRQEVRQKWVAALRSGEYKQGKSFLRNKDNTFCCLGVLCDLAVKEGIIPEGVLETVSEGSTRLFYTYADDSVGVPPPAVVDWVGLIYPGGYFPGAAELAKGFHSLTGANDAGNCSFDDIASLIEEEPEGLFEREIHDEAGS